MSSYTPQFFNMIEGYELTVRVKTSCTLRPVRRQKRTASAAGHPRKRRSARAERGDGVRAGRGQWESKYNF